jgi:peptidoglycan hydrolase-like protein with peptidoglycan-binding domain
MYIHTGARLGQPQKPLISEYIKWVQRSLNLSGECLQVDGIDRPAYREAVKRFQRKVKLPDNGQVDKHTQDALIRSNQRNPIYIDWVQAALNLRRTARLDPNAIRRFQEVVHMVDPNVKVDGVVGPKTEGAIIRFTFSRPPGECV